MDGLSPQREAGAAHAGKVLLVTAVPEQRTAWTKARRDVMRALHAQGYHLVHVPETAGARDWRHLAGQLWASLGAGAHVLIEYPFPRRRRAWLLYLLCRWRRARLHALIHDLDSLRFADSPQRREIAVLKLFDGLISHNPVMTAWLRRAGIAAVVEDLHLFDYIGQPGRYWHERGMSSPLKVVCAGNLSYPKARYLYDERIAQLQGVEISLFGEFFEPHRSRAPGVRYKGVFDPETPALDDSYHFGLVWDGAGVDSCEGHYGQYMRFNNPHKLSLYLCMGLPVIVWEEAAIAHFVLHHGVGVTVSDLRELGELGARVDSRAYRRMARNARALSPRLRRGEFLHAALQRLLSPRGEPGARQRP